MTDSHVKPVRRVRFGVSKGLPQIAALVVILLIYSLVAPNFFSLHMQDGRLFGSLIDILNRGAPVALLALGMTLVIATGGIDLSVGAVMAIAGATAASLAAQGYALPVILLAAVLTGAVCGLWNGFLVAVLQIQPIVATLMLMVAGRGVAQLITEGQIITFAHPSLAHLGSGSLFYLPMPVIIACAMLLLLWLLTRKTALGLFIEAVGINVGSARNAGISTRLILISVYVICGICAAVAGVIITADIRGADANNAGLWLELDAILAVALCLGAVSICCFR